jgi:hypothetical protein
MSGFVADSTGLIQERWTDDFSLRSGLVLDEVAGIFRFGFSGVIADLAVRSDGGGISGRHLYTIDSLLEALMTTYLKKNISIFFQILYIFEIMLFILNIPPLSRS